MANQSSSPTVSMLPEIEPPTLTAPVVTVEAAKSSATVIGSGA
jgi:hypothetical protein